ncbi:MAG: 2,3-bisphosphoglycerate-independent phosphoglycerate mutase [Chloroflexi bacterium]|nr:2,3-bisphosphoglycerate-independent phosphoglycerate mutase [Chloroflexota bacterium]
MEELFKELLTEQDTKMILLVIDGLGGLPDPSSGLTELETAETPNLDSLARTSTCGLSVPIGPGITPGSGPAHLSLFGYNPVRHIVGRGVLSALGVDFPLKENDVAARINFATVDNGIITDRRAGRIPDKYASKLCELLNKIEIPGVEVFVRHEKEHRGVVIFRGEGLSDRLEDMDPQKTGVPPLPAKAVVPEAQKTASIADEFVEAAAKILSKNHPAEYRANYVMLRGFASHPGLELFNDRYLLKAAAIAEYPMYRGLARLLGMEVLEKPDGLEDEVRQLKENYNNYDFFFFHVKKTDSTGEDGDFAAKVKAIEAVDKLVPAIVELKPDCLVITGDHSTPSILKSHSWHPVPYMLYSKYARHDKISGFSETECGRASLGRFPAIDNMVLMLAHALRLKKFGA